MSNDYHRINRAHWDERAPAHADSPDYALGDFADPAHLSDVVRFDLPRLGEVRDLRGVHLQCHIGTDTVSLARLGARMTGLDFSAPALVEARRLAARANVSVEFHEADVYSASDLFGREQFDLVFTGIGALCWLPKIRPWASVVSALLRPGGRLFLREAHPVLFSLDGACHDGQLRLIDPYFETEEPILSVSAGSYVATNTPLRHNLTHQWNHSLGEIVTALLDEGMRLTQLVEHDSVPWEALPGQMERLEGGEWRLRHAPQRLPHTFTLQAIKN
jgi:2-polyprenyl-3-methyl-5-hydroxy-6-metoxy-1,4-benzoquinol methylase